jgi:hypothetical protein
MSDVIGDVQRFRARLSAVCTQLENVRDLLREESECDCPPEWPRCAPCRARLRLQAIERQIDNELKKLRL